jgi:uncharacterized membrane protein (UPF0127 family)
MKKILVNTGRQKIKANLLETPEELSSGLMFKKGSVILKLKKESKFRASIHTFFCLPLLVVWLDKNKKVVDIKKTVPFWFYFPKKPAKYVFETTNLNIKIGKKFSWKIL